MAYSAIDWDDPKAQDDLDEACNRALAANRFRWGDLTREARERIERECMAQMEANRQHAHAEAQIDMNDFDARR